MFARYGMRCGGNWCWRPCRGRNATFRPATSPITMRSLGGPNGVSTVTSSAAERNSYSPEPPITPMLAWPATVAQATFEPEDEDDLDAPEDEPDDEQPEEPEPDDDDEEPQLDEPDDDEEESEPDDDLPDFLSPDLSLPDDPPSFAALFPASDESDEPDESAPDEPASESDRDELADPFSALSFLARSLESLR